MEDMVPVLEVTPMVSSSHQELNKSERIGAISFEKCLWNNALTPSFFVWESKFYDFI